MTAVSVSGVWLGSTLVCVAVPTLAALFAWRFGWLDRLIASLPEEHDLWPDGVDESLEDALARFDLPQTVVDSRFAAMLLAEGIRDHPSRRQP